MSYQKYYVPEQSKFPIYAATALFLLVMGAAGTINDLGKPDSISVYILIQGSLFLQQLYIFGLEQLLENILQV